MQSFIQTHDLVALSKSYLMPIIIIAVKLDNPNQSYGQSKIAIKTGKFQRILVNTAQACIFHPNTPSCSSIKELLNAYIIAVKVDNHNGQSKIQLSKQLHQRATKCLYYSCEIANRVMGSQSKIARRILVKIAHAFSSKTEPFTMQCFIQIHHLVARASY